MKKISSPTLGHRDGPAGFWIHLRALFVALLAMAGLAHAQAAGIDIPGPDGLYYPDFRQAGIPGGIPTVTNVLATITSTQATSDLAGAIDAAVTAATGPGVISLPQGTYNLTRPVLIAKDGIVLRGAGNVANGTFLNFTYQAPSGTVEFYQPPVTATSLYNNTWVDVHADPVGLVELDILAGAPGTANASLTKVDGIDVKTSNGGWGNTFSRDCVGSKVRGAVGTGTKIVVGCAKYGTWNPTTKVMTVTSTIYTPARTYTIVNGTDATAFPQPQYLAAITFAGKGELTSTGTHTTASAARGDTTLQLTGTSGFAVNDPVVFAAPRNAIWDAQVGNKCTSNIFRYYQYQITALTGTTVTLNQPLRIDYPIEGTNPAPFIKKLGIVQNCGVEELTLTQTNNVWTCGLQFSYAWKCWSKNVTVNKAGRHPIYMTEAKWCQIENCNFNDAWFHGGGGTAYCGFEMAFDCLMQGVTTSKLRHGPLVQNSAAGNVIRNCTFLDSEAHWHAGWTNENLFENDTMIANLGNGSYGNGLFSSAPGDAQHGPNGPRNVVYNCDISSPGQSTWLGGSNTNWLFLHNRFAADTGNVFQAQSGSSGHLFANNVCVLPSASCAINLVDSASTGSTFRDSDFDGVFNVSTAFLAGLSSATQTGNTAADNLVQQALTNSGFETGDLTAWDATGDGGMSVVVTTDHHLGTHCMKVTDSSATLGSSLYSAYLPVSPGHVYAARYFFTNTGKGISVYLRFYNSSHAQLSAFGQDDMQAVATWQPSMVQSTAPAGAAYARINVHSYSGATSTSQFDDFEFGEIGGFGFNTAAFDGGFEGGQWVGWDTTDDNGQSTIVADALTGFATNHVLQVLSTGSGVGSSLSSAKFAATPGHTYQVRCDAQAISGGGVGIDLNFYNAASVLIAHQTMDLPPEPSLYPAENVTPPADGNMKQFAQRMVAPAGTATASILIHSYAGSAVKEYVDNIAVLDLPPRPQPAVPSIFAWQRNPVFPQGNAGFETGTIASWNNSGDNGMSVITTGAHTGTYGVRVTDNSATLSSSLQSQTFPVLPGVSYKVSFWDRIISGNGAGVYVVFLNASQGILSSNVVNLQATDTSWTSHNGTFTTPTGAAYAYVRIHSFSASIVTADLDDIQFSTVLP